MVTLFISFQRLIKLTQPTEEWKAHPARRLGVNKPTDMHMPSYNKDKPNFDNLAYMNDNDGATKF